MGSVGARLLAVAFAMSLSLLSGCTAAEPPRPVASQDTSVVRAPGDWGAEAARLEGLVVDDQSVPIANTSVGILGTNLSARADATGSFAFTNLAPGSVVLQASATGFTSGARKVELSPGATARAVLALAPIPIDEPRIEIIGPLAGFFQCAVGTPNVGTSPQCNIVFGQDKTWFDFHPDATTDAIVGETRWTSSAFATTPKLHAMLWNLTDDVGYVVCDDTGPSPLYWEYHYDGTCADRTGKESPPQSKENLPPRGSNVTFDVDVPSGSLTKVPPEPGSVSYQQHFEVIVTLFHDVDVPRPYTAFKDG